MAASRSNNTMAEGLYKTLSQIAQMATAPDADLQFLTQLQVMITQYLRSYQPGSMGGDQSMQMGGQQPPPPQQMGGQMGMGGQMPGLAQGQPNMDEIGRILAGAGGQQ